jgi:hypothetical protein
MEYQCQERSFWNIVPVRVLLRQDFLAHSITKIPLDICMSASSVTDLWFLCLVHSQEELLVWQRAA